MNSSPLLIEAPSDTVVCPECGQESPTHEAFCTVCGVALDDSSSDSALVPLTPGTVLAELCVIERVEPHGRENRYHATRLGEQPGWLFVRERIREEAEDWPAVTERIAGLGHPALLVPERYIEQDGREYLLCPDIQGIRLSTRIGCTSEREATGWGIQICQAVGVLHRHKLLCLELPPEGIVLDKESRLRLTLLDAVTPLGEGSGPASVMDGYAAPEVYKGTMLGETADVFAIGAVLYSLVVGRRLPVEGWVVQPELPLFYPEKVLSPPFERVLRKALAFDARDRYADLEALKAALLEINRPVRIRSAWLTDVGQVRDHNEDSVLVKEQGQGTIAGNDFCGLYVISDGMGGAEAGEVASALTIRTVARHLEDRVTGGARRDAWTSCLTDAVEAANRAILDYAKEHPEAAGLGATVVAAVVTPETLALAWVGDSRIYVWEHGQLRQLSRDHSLVARLVEIGQLTPEEARTHEHRNVLIRSLGSKPHVAVDTLSRPLRRGARLLLCSDGLTSHVEDAAVADILSRHRDPYDAALEYVVAANAGGGSDNISVVVVFHE